MFTVKKHTKITRNTLTNHENKVKQITGEGKTYKL